MMVVSVFAVLIHDICVFTLMVYDELFLFFFQFLFSFALVRFVMVVCVLTDVICDNCRCVLDQFGS